MQPFDLFHPDRKRRVKLYVKRVFITDEGTELVPHYLRFLRGVIDSEDLPLNISRETLQKNTTLDKIKDSVVKRTLAELKKRAEKNPDEYSSFWKNFGAVLKEGLCEAISPKEQILEACRFDSSCENKLVSLDDYVSRMKKGQEHIYYLTGEAPDKLANSPQLEGFRKRGIEVLLLTDHVDDFWVNVVHEYKKHPFKSVTRSNIDLDAIEKVDSVDADNKDAAATEESMQSLISELKEVYGQDIKDIRITHKLTDSAVCLSVEDGAMDIRLERFLKEQKQITTNVAKIMEINPNHPVIINLSRRATLPDIKQDEFFKDAAMLLLDQAKVVEGVEIADTNGFSRRLSRFMIDCLKAA
jgi:molecular chaperone HtpG